MMNSLHSARHRFLFTVAKNKRLSLNTALALLLGILFSLLAKTALAQNITQEQIANQTTFEVQFSQAQLAQLLAPIALYPDSLLTHILIASTYPLEVIEAKRWLDKHDGLSKKRMMKKANKKNWDPSINALLAFPRILARLNNELTWTRNIGDAFLQDEARLLASIQTLRQQAEAAGNLDKMENMTISREKHNIIIEAVQPEVIYVPYYDSRVIYGRWAWDYHPPVYWSQPWGVHHNYVHLSHYNPFYWHSGVHISFNYFFSAFNWHHRHIVVVNHHKTRHHRRKVHIISSGYAKRWHHKPIHRRGVAYRSSITKERYQSNRTSVNQSAIARNKIAQHNVTGKVTRQLKHKLRHKIRANKQVRSPVLPTKVIRHTVAKHKTIRPTLKPVNKKVINNDHDKAIKRPKSAYKTRSSNDNKARVTHRRNTVTKVSRTANHKQRKERRQ